jgi:hypothetical protein
MLDIRHEVSDVKIMVIDVIYQNMLRFLYRDIVHR